MPDPTIPAWKRLHRVAVYQNPWITVYEDQVQLPTGQTTIYGVVTPPHDFVGIVPLLDSKTVILVRQYRYIQDKVTWEIPSGAMEAGETPHQAAQRELREEIGYQANHFEQLSLMRSNKSVMDDQGFIFLATGLAPSKAIPDETEAFQVVSVSLDLAMEMVTRFEITDCVSIIGLLLVQKHLRPESSD
ncbi:MAG: NUDIX domain-containing protein [Candidatus Hodarchaeota archaeon]